MGDNVSGPLAYGGNLDLLDKKSKIDLEKSVSFQHRSQLACDLQSRSLCL